MTGKEFYKKFNETVTVKKYGNIYSSNRDFTKAVTKEICDILYNGGLEINCEYYNVDVIGWKYTDTDDNFSKLKRKSKMTGNRKPWQLVVAVEHENNQKDWIYELIKLAQFSCPLKIVIGYTPDNNGNRESIEKDRIAYAAECLKASSYNLNGEFLLILGCCEKNKYTSFGYLGYLFNGETFESISIKE